MDLVGPSAIQSAKGQGIVNGHYQAEVDDLLPPVVYTWTSDGEVIGSGAQVTVQFDTPPSGKSHLRQVGVTVSETRMVRISTVSHQGPGGHGGHGGQGGGGSNNPQAEP